MAKFYGTGNVPKPDREPDFLLKNKKSRATASYWIMQIVDENNCTVLYRYDNGLWRVGKCSMLCLKDGQLMYSHKGPDSYVEYTSDSEFYKELKVELAKHVLNMIIDSVLLEEQH